MGTGSPQAGAAAGEAALITFGCRRPVAGARIEGLPPVPPTPLPVDDTCCFAAYDGPKRKVGGSFGLGCSCERCCTSWAKAASRCHAGCIFHPVATHPKRQNPSRIQAQRVAIWSTEPVPFGHLRTRSKQRWMDGAGRCGLGEFSIRWARIRNSRTPAGFRPNGLPLGQQSQCRLGTFEPAQSKGGWMGLDARIRNGRTPAGCRPNGLPLGQQSRCRLGTFEPAQSKGGWMGLDAVAWVNFPSGGHATGCHWVSRAGAVWAPSNPLKAKVDGWGWTLWPG